MTLGIILSCHFTYLTKFCLSPPLEHKEANVVVLAGKGVASPHRSVIGCVKVLSHHSWSDLEYLVKGSLDEFAYVQNYDENVNDKFMESSAYLKQKHLTVKEEDSVTQLIQVNIVFSFLYCMKRCQ